MTKKQRSSSRLPTSSPTLTDDFFNIPLLGQVRASGPATASGDYNLSDLIKNYQHSDRKTISLEVLDDAMARAGILQGDILAVRLDAKPRSGDIVVVQLGENVYIRKFYRQDQLIRLETTADPPNPIVIENKTPGFNIIGKVTSVTRKF